MAAFLVKATWRTRMNKMSRVLMIALVFLVALGTHMAVAVEKPDWPLEVINWDFGLAYPGTTYDFRLAVIGGRYPYTFELKQGPEGLQAGSEHRRNHLVGAGDATGGRDGERAHHGC